MADTIKWNELPQPKLMTLDQVSVEFLKAYAKRLQAHVEKEKAIRTGSVVDTDRMHTEWAKWLAVEQTLATVLGFKYHGDALKFFGLLG